jgi:hypothetical protein
MAKRSPMGTWLPWMPVTSPSIATRGRHDVGVGLTGDPSPPHRVVDLIWPRPRRGRDRADLPGHRAGSDEFPVRQRSVSRIT